MTTIFTHWDSDGISGGVLYKKTHPDCSINFPSIFGGTEGWQDGDIMVDMCPNDPNVKGLVMDHHPGHKSIRNYQLIYAEYPASLIVYNHVREELKEEDKWKVVVGLQGDVSPEFTPNEIWEDYNYLLDTDEWDLPLYMRLSSPINSFCRAGKYMKAFDKLYNAKKPMDLITDPEIVKMKKEINKEFRRIRDEGKIRHFKHVWLWEYESDYNMGGYLAARLGNQTKHTIIVLNKKSGGASIRGVLASLIKSKLPDIQIGGHPIAMGMHLKSMEEYYKFIKVCEEI